MKSGKEYWDLKIEETKELFSKRPVWMENYDNDYPSAAFIKGLIAEYKPEKMLEVGSAAGWAAYYMLDEACKHNAKAKLTSVDFIDFVYYNQEKKIGDAFFEQNSPLLKNWDLRTNTYLIDFANETEEKYDFVFIDANHFQPWAALDFLAVLPHLKKGAVVVFHDVFLNEISLGTKRPDRHPETVCCGYERNIGPNCVYSVFSESMTLSYDDVTPNCAAVVVEDKMAALQKIFYALQIEWENVLGEYENKSAFLEVLSKHLTYVEKHFGRDEAKEFSKVFFKNFNRIFSANKNVEEELKKYKAYADSIEQIKQGKKVVLWGASLFLHRLLSNKLLDKNDILGIIDSNPQKYGTQIEGLEIYAPEAIEALRPDVIISTVFNSNCMKKNIEKTLKEKNIASNAQIVADFY